MQTRSKSTRSKILYSAGELFSRQGYNATGVAEICSQARVSKGAFYYHFSTKQDLFLALLYNWLSGLDLAFETFKAESNDIPEGIQAMAQMAAEVLKSSDSNNSILLEFWMQAYRDPELWGRAIAPYTHYVDYFSELFDQGMHEGSIKPVDTRSAARVIVALGLGYLMQALVHPDDLDWENEIGNGVDYLLSGIARRSQ